MMEKDQWLSALKPFVNSTTQWDAFVAMLDHNIDMQHKLLEQSGDLPTITRAQGVVGMLKRLKNLRTEVNAK